MPGEAYLRRWRPRVVHVDPLESATDSAKERREEEWTELVRRSRDTAEIGLRRFEGLEIASGVVEWCGCGRQPFFGGCWWRCATNVRCAARFRVRARGMLPEPGDGAAVRSEVWRCVRLDAAEGKWVVGVRQRYGAGLGLRACGRVRGSCGSREDRGSRRRYGGCPAVGACTA
jgi:hypothetical protein